MQGEMVIPTIRLIKGMIEVIDQTKLPATYDILTLSTVDMLCSAIERLAIRGAPALGIAGAYGLLLAVEERWRKEGCFIFDEADTDVSLLSEDVTTSDVRGVIRTAADKIGATRPTAVNLFWALDRLKKVYEKEWPSTRDLLRSLYDEAKDIFDEDLDMCRRLGAHGEKLLEEGDTVMTHCNAGGLATSGYGTALGVIFAAVEAGKRISVFANETRPLLQGARLTSWECLQRNIPVKVVCEGAAGFLLSGGYVSKIIVGADRIAANGDTANKIGTMNLAIIADFYDVPFYVAAPSSTIDHSLKDGSRIPIEMRTEEEVKRCSGVEIAPPAAAAMNPAFDVTPHELISAIITEKQIYYPPFDNLN